MELRQLHQFVAVAEERQFTRAAARCSMAQSALSASIRALERDLGAALFVRTTRRVTLTPAGRALLGEARRTLAAAAAARTAVREVQGMQRGSLAVGGVPTPALFDQAALLRRFRGRYPGVEIRHVRGNSPDLIEDVAAGRLDLAFVRLPPRLPLGLAAHELIARPLALICRPDHPLAGRAEVTMADLAGETFVGASAGSAGDRPGARPDGSGRTAAFEVNDEATMLDFVEHGMGVAVLVADLVTDRPGLCAVPLAGAAESWRLGAVTPVDVHMSPAAGEMVQLALGAVA